VSGPILFFAKHILLVSSLGFLVGFGLLAAARLARSAAAAAGSRWRWRSPESRSAWASCP